jgi:hypothetical protein
MRLTRRIISSRETSIEGAAVAALLGIDRSVRMLWILPATVDADGP